MTKKELKAFNLLLQASKQMQDIMKRKKVDNTATTVQGATPPTPPTPPTPSAPSVATDDTPDTVESIPVSRGDVLRAGISGGLMAGSDIADRVGLYLSDRGALLADAINAVSKNISDNKFSSNIFTPAIATAYDRQGLKKGAIAGSIGDAIQEGANTLDKVDIKYNMSRRPDMSAAEIEQYRKAAQINPRTEQRASQDRYSYRQGRGKK